MCARGAWIVGLAGGVLSWAAAAAADDDAPRSTPLVVRQSSVVLQSDDRDASRHLRDLALRKGAQLVRATDSEIVLDVPTAGYAELVRELRSMGYVRSERVSTRDVSQDIARAEADMGASTSKGACRSKRRLSARCVRRTTRGARRACCCAARR
jgi:hypothetical protein